MILAFSNILFRIIISLPNYVKFIHPLFYVLIRVVDLLILLSNFHLLCLLFAFKVVLPVIFYSLLIITGFTYHFILIFFYCNSFYRRPI
jgi:hypothetical protein